MKGYFEAMTVFIALYVFYLFYYRRTQHKEELERQKTLRIAISEVERIKKRLNMGDDK